MHHVIELNNLSQKLTSRNEDQVLDVYKDSDTSEVLGCIEDISKLKAKILLHREEFPENTILKDLVHCIDLFLTTPCDQPQMYFANLVEKLLGKFFDELKCCMIFIYVFFNRF